MSVHCAAAAAAVVVPTLGQRPEYLRRTLDSLKAQRGVGVAVVVVAPAAAQDVAAECAHRGVLFVEQTGRGMSQAINQGWEAAGAGAEFWGWLGDDDLLPPHSLHTAVAALQAAPHASMVYGRCCYIDENDHPLFEARPSRFAARLLRYGPDLVPQPGSLARAAAVRAVGCLDESLRFAMDLDLFLKLQEVGPIIYVPQKLASFRWHGGSTTRGDPTGSDSEARMVRQRTWVGPRAVIGPRIEPVAMLAGRVLHKFQRHRPQVR